ncbi:MAG TPA: pyridoxal phosphate-dependent aminotransferase [Candidatus Angelobacter sp.]|nr:pyridoxal phosphate-dependent aminotransferase [Candidatus Angelobacter sp.]
MFATRTNWNLTPNPLAEALARFRASGRKLLDLTASNPTECGFRYDGASILKALITPAVLKYHPDPRGLEAARKAVTEYYCQRGDEVRLDDVILTVSTSEAYSYAFRLLCNPGDEVLVPTPSYPLFDFLADIQDVKLIRYSLLYDHGWQIDFHALESAITPRTRAVIVVHPNNPTGHYTRAQEVEKLNSICIAHDLVLIADEVFLDFPLAQHRPGSFAQNNSVLTLTMSGLSKISGLPQMKFSWLAVNGPPARKKDALARLEVIADTFLSMNAAIQAAAPTLLAQRHGIQQQLMARVQSNLAELDRQLSEEQACSRLAVEGGWYAVLRVPATRCDEELALELLEDAVYVHPGHFYDFPAEGYLVVSLITPERDFSEGIEKLLALF